MSAWAEKYSIVAEVRCLGLLIGVSFRSPEEDGNKIFVARAVRNAMLINGVWAINGGDPTVRMYPALNMDEQGLLEGLDIMEAAIQEVDKSGGSVGDYPAIPSGNFGF